MAKRKYTKGQAKRACRDMKAKAQKLYQSGYISAQKFVNLSKDFDMIHKKVG